MSSNNVGHFITSTIITLQHFATLHHTSPNCTSLHLSTLHLFSFTLHYSPIWLNPSTFPVVLFHLITKLDTVRFSHPQTYFQSNEPLHCPKEPLNISLHFLFRRRHRRCLRKPPSFLYRLNFPSVIYYINHLMPELHFCLF